MTLKMLSLFAGVGGFDLAASWVKDEQSRQIFETCAFCEIDPFCQKVLRKNFGQEIVIFDDVRKLTAQSLSAAGIERVDVVAGGFPCQDISTAGKGEGIEGARSGLWFEMLRVISEVRPAWVVAENVPALRTRGVDTVCSGLEAAGYSVWTGVVGAWAVGAPHRRNRVWIVAHAGSSAGHSGSERSGRQARADFNRRCAGAKLVNTSVGRVRRGRRAGEELGAGSENGVGYSERISSERRRGAGIVARAPGEGQGNGSERQRVRDAVDATGEDGSVAYTEESERERCRPSRPGRDGLANMRWPARPGERQHEWEAPRVIESGMGDSVNGVSRRVAGYRTAKLKALGNAVVPAVVYPIFEAIAQAERTP